MKIFIIFFGLLFSSNYCFSSDYSNFRDADITSIKAFTRDISNIVGASTLYTARVIGFGGFAISYKSIYQIKPENNDSIFRKDKSFGINFLQVESGMPYRVDLYLRAGGNDGFNVIGGGLRYGIINVVDDLYRPNLILSLNSHMGVYRDFYLVSFGAQIASSIKLSNVIMPFISFGGDTVKLSIEKNNDPSLTGKKIYEKVFRTTFGLRMKISWINLMVAYDIYDKKNGVNGSFGVRF